MSTCNDAWHQMVSGMWFCAQIILLSEILELFELSEGLDFRLAQGILPVLVTIDRSGLVRGFSP
jgi:hypothetical protein